MIFLLILFATMMLCFALARVTYEYTELYTVIVITAGISLLISLILLPVSYYGTQSEIAEFQSVQNTITVARKKGKDLEAAAYQIKIAESNQWLARVQYWNKTIFDIYYPDEVMELHPIE